ncbi:MAG TPA: glycosyl hydrolase family 8 [Edaphobacter sp.]|nr:glycosyl hydrolase family 8 [Edaphobacter sp.]
MFGLNGSKTLVGGWRRWVGFQRITTALCVVALACGGVVARAASNDGKGAYETGKYRNLFAEAGHSQAEIDAKINAAYQQLFHGDGEKQAIYFAAGKNENGPLGYVTDWANHDVRTEGMSYGMMIAVQMNKKEEFDALWNWVMTHMYISDPAHPSYGYFSWSAKTDGTVREETPAPDGEEYFAMSLLFAANRWGSGAGIYDYQGQAERLLRAMRHREVKSGPTKFGPRKVGPEVNEEHAMILFVPGVMEHPFSDPSYHLPAFYELWARWGPKEDREFWARAAEVSRDYFVKTTNPKTGLASVYANFDGTPHETKFVQSGEFGYDAWRTASNWSVDWSWWHKAPSEQVLSDRIQTFFAGQGINKYSPVYTLDGKPMGSTPGFTPETDAPIGLVGTNAVASLAAKDKAQARLFVDALWNAPVPDGYSRYYDGMLYMMSLLHASGQFRIWGPK